MAQAEMWKTYRYHDVPVRVIQKWTDPYGRRMIRIEATAEDDDRAIGLFEEEFVRDARPDLGPDTDRDRDDRPPA